MKISFVYRQQTAAGSSLPPHPNLLPRGEGTAGQPAEAPAARPAMPASGSRQQADDDPPSPRGIALLGNAQRSIRINRPTVQGGPGRWKAFPNTPKTIGDLIHIRRREQRLSQHELGVLLGVSKARGVARERDRSLPTEADWVTLGSKVGVSAPANANHPNS